MLHVVCLLNKQEAIFLDKNGNVFAYNMLKNLTSRSFEHLIPDVYIISKQIHLYILKSSFSKADIFLV